MPEEPLPYPEYNYTTQYANIVSDLNNYISQLKGNQSFFTEEMYRKDFIKQIDDDTIKTLENRDMIVLTNEEIKKASCNNNPELILLKELYKDSNLSLLKFKIGSMLRGTFDRDETNSNYLVLGHIIDGKVYNNHHNSYKDNASKSNFTKSYVLLNLNTNKLLSKSEKDCFNYIGPANTNIIYQILNKLSYKIINTELSGKVFGLAKVKANSLNKVVNIILDRGNSNKLSTETYYAIIYDELNNRNMKYCLADLQVELPNILGYNFPKDKTIIRNCKVILKENPNNIYLVKEVYTNISSKKISKKGSSRQLDVLRIVNTKNIHDDRKVYAKNVKLI